LKKYFTAVEHSRTEDNDYGHGRKHERYATSGAEFDKKRV
jgi:hypothetical protein